MKLEGALENSIKRKLGNVDSIILNSKMLEPSQYTTTFTISTTSTSTISITTTTTTTTPTTTTTTTNSTELPMNLDEALEKTIKGALRNLDNIIMNLKMLEAIQYTITFTTSTKKTSTTITT